MLKTKNNKMIQRIMMMAVLMMGLFTIGLSSTYGQGYQYTTTLPSTPLSGDVYTIHAGANLNFVLTTYNHDAGVAAGTGVSLWENSNNKGQQWIIVPTGEQDKVWYGKKYAQYYIMGRASGLMLGHNSKIYNYDTKNIYLKWLFIPSVTGGYYLKPVAENNKALTKNVTTVENGSNLVLNWFDQKMEFKLSKKTEFSVPRETTASNTDRLNSDQLKIRWQNGQPIFADTNPDTAKPFATIQTYIPSYMVTDSNISLPDKMNISPYYILQKESFPNKVLEFDNSGNTSSSRPTYNYSAGITTSESTSRTHTFGISATVGTNDKSPIQASVTASYEYGFTKEKSTGTENTTSKGVEFDVKPGDAAALYTIRYVYTVKRKDETPVNKWEVLGPADFKTISSSKPNLSSNSSAAQKRGGIVVDKLDGDWVGYYADGTKSEYIWNIGQTGSKLSFENVGTGSNMKFSGTITDNIVTDSYGKKGTLSTDRRKITWSDKVTWVRQ